MPDRISPAAPTTPRLKTGGLQFTWSLVAALLAVAATVETFIALRHAGEDRWVHVAVYIALLAMLAVMFILVRQNERAMRAVATANTELGEAVAHAQEAQARAEAEAHQKARVAALLDAALGSAPVAFAFFDRDLRLLRVNETYAALTGKDLMDHVGLALSEIDPAVAHQVEPRLREVLETREPVLNVEYRMQLPPRGGNTRNILSSYYPIFAPDDDVFAIGAAIVDVTEVKALEEQLVQAQKMEAVGRLAGGVAHDFNNLLTVISSYAELILYDPKMEGSEEIAEIQGATKRAAKLTRQLLAFSRRQAMEPRIVNPNDVVRGVESMIRRVFDTNITVTSMLAPDTPLIRVDPGQLEQVVMNLAINAADAMPDGGTLRIETCGASLRGHAKPDPELADGLYAAIRVRDTGHGMDPATIAQVFEPFFTTKEPGKGTGLGLSTVYGIVKQSSGSVDVNSTPGNGSVFSVYLPAADEESP
jgi:PAS domain S-box-containing protein